jgi:hypothetical protein
MTLEAINNELARHILVPHPVPTQGTRVGADQADYIRELGAALDEALSKVIRENPTPIVRLNATRLLATACRSGAAAHYPTVTDLVANPNYPPEVKNYAYQAAANLLAAYDLNDYRSRRHSAPDKVVEPLIKALEEAIFPPAQLETKKPDAKAADPTPDQLAVTGFVRRNAVRALAQVRFASFPANNPTVYPAHTLARVALSDPALVPAPSPTEAAEAVMGLCNLTPNKAYSPDLAAEAVAAGLRTFAAPRAGNPLDRSYPWRGYAARLTDMLRTWRATFDAGFDPAKPFDANPASVPKAVELVARNAIDKVLAPMDKVDSTGKADVTVRVDLAGLDDVLSQLRRAPNRPPTLFRDVARTALPGTEKN